MHRFTQVVLLYSFLASSGFAQSARGIQSHGPHAAISSTAMSTFSSSIETRYSSPTNSSITKSSSTTSSFRTLFSTTTSISKTLTTVSSAHASTSSGKRGLAYNNATLAAEFLPYNSKISWGYNWANHSSGLSSSFNYVPMLWGNYSSLTDGWDSAVTSALASGSTHLLSFNEPDESSQSNLTVAEATILYKTYLQPHASKAKLGSPAVTNGGGSMGLTWLSNFMRACATCTIDFVAIHWYVVYSDFAHLIDMVNYIKYQITTAHTDTGKPVWITEFGFLDSPTNDQVNSFLTAVLPWLDNQTFVERYSFFMVDPTKLLSAGPPSTAGSQANTYAT